MPRKGMTGTDDGERPMARTYAAVLAVEVLVLLALWAAGRYFGSA
jgi:hypothetical protein